MSRGSWRRSDGPGGRRARGHGKRKLESDARAHGAELRSCACLSPEISIRRLWMNCLKLGLHVLAACLLLAGCTGASEEQEFREAALRLRRSLEFRYLSLETLSREPTDLDRVSDLIDRGDLEQAIFLLEHSKTEALGKNPYYWLLLGSILSAQDRRDAAREALLQAQNLAEDDATRFWIWRRLSSAGWPPASGTADEILGVVIEQGFHGGGSAPEFRTIVAFSDGATSLYSSFSQSLIGGEFAPEIRQAATTLLRAATPLLIHTEHAEEFGPPPRPRRIRIVFFTPAAFRLLEVSDEQFETAIPLQPLRRAVDELRRRFEGAAASR